MKEQNLLQSIGKVPPNENGFKGKCRFHQGWWRTFVLNEDIGRNPSNPNDTVCNTISNGESSGKNFLSSSALESVIQTLEERKDFEAGLFSENRLYNNLLSSQPLAFNFFGELKQNLDFAKNVLSSFIPDLKRVSKVLFEYAPKEKYSGDNSAFDIAFEVETDKKGIFGLECKYTDTFSQKEFDRENYRDIFLKSNIFIKPYESYIDSRFNQLFRNQLIAESLVQNKKFDFVITGLFCFQEDVKAIEIGYEFQKMLRNDNQVFKVLTYADYIAAMQKLDLTWDQRELTMTLWARYCGLKLSKSLFDVAQIKNTTT